VIGVPIFAAGIAAVFLTSNGPGSAALVTIGGVFLLLAVLGDRVEALELGGATISLGDVAKSRFALATQKEADDPKAARELRAQGRGVQRLANEYAQIRQSMKAGHDRTNALEHVLAETEQLGKDHRFEPVDVWDWFDEGTPETRITALALMHADEEVRDFFAALDAIEHSRTAFEQYHGLRLADEMLPGLTALERRWLRLAVDRAQHRRRWGRRLFGPGTDRWALSERIKTRLDSSADAPTLGDRPSVSGFPQSL
jgi:hypothetical protein